jgi:general stress protein YciG
MGNKDTASNGGNHRAKKLSKAELSEIGRRGGEARAAALNPAKRKRIAKKAAAARWGN